MPTLNLIIGTDPRGSLDRPYEQDPTNWRVYNYEDMFDRPYNKLTTYEIENAYQVIRQMAYANLSAGLNVAVVAPFNFVRQMTEFLKPNALTPRLHATEEGVNFLLELPFTVVVTKPRNERASLIHKFNEES